MELRLVKFVCAAILAVGLFGKASQAAPIEVIFDSGNAPLPWVEKGFEFSPTAISGNAQIIDGGISVQDFAVGDMITVERTGGGLFSLTGFEIYRHDSLHDTFRFRGFKDGMEVFLSGIFAVDGGEFIDQIGPFATPQMDLLQIVGTGGRGGSLYFGGFTFDVERAPAVPLPAGAFLLVSAFGLLKFRDTRAVSPTPFV